MLEYLKEHGYRGGSLNSSSGFRFRLQVHDVSFGENFVTLCGDFDDFLNFESGEHTHDALLIKNIHVKLERTFHKLV